MKALLGSFCVAVLLIVTPYTVGAHGGGLNRDGCHRETATGGYHCHRAKSDDRKTWETVGYVAGGVLAVGLVLWLIRSPNSYQQVDLLEPGLRFTPVQQDRVGVFVEWRF